MRRCLIVLTSSRQISLLDRVLSHDLAEGEDAIVASLMPSARLGSEPLQRLEKKSMTYIDLSEIERSQSDRDLSLVTTRLINESLRGALASEHVKRSSTHWGVSLIETQDNDMYTYAYRELAGVTDRFISLVLKFKPARVIAFGARGMTLQVVERPDIETLYDNEITMCPLIERICKKLHVPVSVVPSVGLVSAWIKPRLRATLLRLFKFATLSRRVLQDRSARSRALRASASEQPGVAVIIRGESEYWTIGPVLQRLREQKKYNLWILQDDILKDPSAKQALQRVREDFIPIHAFSSIGSFLRDFLLGVVRSRQFDRLVGGLKFVYTEENNKMLLHEAILRQNSDVSCSILRAMSKRFSEEILFISELSRFLERYRPKLLITMSMVDNWGKIIRQTGDRYGIQTLGVQNAALSFLSLPTMIFSHKFAVAGQRQKDGMAALGADPKQLVVTGLPLYDPHLNRDVDASGTRKALGMSPDHKLILVTTQPTKHEENEEFVRATLDAAKSCHDVVVVIKLHPRERVERYAAIDAWIKKNALQAQILHGRDVVELIGAADLMVSRFSTTIQSALMVGTPVIAYVAKEYQGFNTDYLETPAVLKAARLSELKDLIFLVLNDPERRELFKKLRHEYLEATVGVADGRASERMVSLIEEMISSGESN